MFKNIIIFDLDGTTIDSTHRQATKPDGTLDLQSWFKNATPEKIAQDKVLPLGRMVSALSKKAYTMICTARTLSDADYEFILANGLKVNKIISRPKGDMTPDAELKSQQLGELFSKPQFRNRNAIMFDDAKSVRSAIRKLGIATLDPDKINKRLNRFSQ